MTPLLRIGARGSALSLAQTKHTRAMLAARLGADPASITITPITTSGDRIQDRRLIEAGGKGLFTKELDEALRDGRVDVAVHSLKDLPTRLDPDIALVCVPEREDPRDAFVSAKATTLEQLPKGALVGTASLRRQAQTLFTRGDLRVTTLRGNVDTRLRKLQEGVADATFLAIAGLKRLGLADRATSFIDPDETPPAACQGALAITARADDPRTRDALAAFENAHARLEIEAERAFLEALDGSCRTPIAALARCHGGRMHFIGEALTPDGSMRWRRTAETVVENAMQARTLGETLGQDIRDEAGDAIVMDA